MKFTTHSRRLHGRQLFISLLLLILEFCCGFLPAASAHEVRPGYLELSEGVTGTWDVLWKVPVRDGKRLGLEVVFPVNCVKKNYNGRLSGGAYIERWQIKCSAPLYEESITISGLEYTRTDVLTRVIRSDGTSQTERLTPRSTTFMVSRVDSWSDVIFTYVPLGIVHILLGIDHLFFVLALLFLVNSWPRLIGTVTAFTLAHSITLALAALGLVRIPQPPVEAVIALSIVFVAGEIIHVRQGKVGLAGRSPWIAAFVFGLLHGLGFAGALHEVGLPETAIPLALACFNIGVELGQLTFVILIFIFFLFIRVSSRYLCKRWKPESSWVVADVIAVPVSYCIGTLAVFWVVERTVAFW